MKFGYDSRKSCRIRFKAKTSKTRFAVVACGHNIETLDCTIQMLTFYSLPLCLVRTHGWHSVNQFVRTSVAQNNLYVAR